MLSFASSVSVNNRHGCDLSVAYRLRRDESLGANNLSDCVLARWLISTAL